MESHLLPTPEQARSALADTAQVQASTSALSATPWPNWFVAVLTGYIAVIPVIYGGVFTDSDWLLPRPAWLALFLVVTAGYSALFGVAARSWRRRTGVALRLDVLPKKATVPLMVGLPAVLLGSAVVFRYTGQPGWLAAASVIGAAVSLSFHRTFVRLHRKGA